MARPPKPGTVYLIHLSAPIGGRAQHYIGWAKHLASRIAHHRKCSGARFLAVAVELNIDFEVVRTWVGDRQLERSSKTVKKPGCSAPSASSCIH